MAKQLIARFEERQNVIQAAIAAYRADGGKGNVKADALGDEVYLGGNAQAVMEIIGHVSRMGHDGLKNVIMV